MPDASYSLLAQLESVKDLAHPPLHLWNPDTVKDIDLVIRRSGVWEHEGSAITRPRLVRLFSTVLRREGDDYFLVTPVEKCRIKVEDAPFLAIAVEQSGEGASQNLRFTTNVAEDVIAGMNHPIRVEVDAATGEPAPYILIREDLWALISRSVYYEMIEYLAEGEVDGTPWLGWWSDGEFFGASPANDLA